LLRLLLNGLTGPFHLGCCLCCHNGQVCRLQRSVCRGDVALTTPAAVRYVVVLTVWGRQLTSFVEKKAFRRSSIAEE
jgi:hypothetical protein